MCGSMATYHARRWRMHRHGTATARGQRLTFRYPITRFNAQLAFGAKMLL